MSFEHQNSKTFNLKLNKIRFKTHTTQARLCTRRVARRQTRKSRDCPHTNATTNAKSEAFSSVARSHCGSDAKTGATTGSTRDENVTVLKNIVLPIGLAYTVALVCSGRSNSMFDKPTRRPARHSVAVFFTL